jgi:hypothetical protein
MKKLLLPFILLIVGTGAGAGAGFLLKPEPLEEAAVDPSIHCEPQEPTMTVEVVEQKDEGGDTVAKSYAKLNNQFVVPIVSAERMEAIVAMSLSIEVLEGDETIIFSAEPKLRDAFLQVMFDHANTGGFTGNFTTGSNMRNLRQQLNRAAQSIVGPVAVDVLILDIVRQDT